MAERVTTSGSGHERSSDKLWFRSRARIVRTIGDELIKGPEAALIELIKNAYDADATKVRVVFHPPLLKPHRDSSAERDYTEADASSGCPINKGTVQCGVEHDLHLGGIDVIDDGHGMSRADIQSRWMEPATTDKKERRKSPSGRRMLGAKGIGRFAASILGETLEMITTAVHQSQDKDISQQGGSAGFETTRLPLVAWNWFKEKRYLDQIALDCEQLEPEAETGTTLHIRGLLQDWTEDRLRTLYEELRRLTTPLAGDNAADFRVYLDLSPLLEFDCGFDPRDIVDTSTEESDEERWLVRPYALLTACDYEVDGIFDDDGSFEGTLTIHRGDQHPIDLKFEVPLQPAREAPCGIVLVRLFIFDRDRESVLQTAKRAQLGDIKVRDARRLLDAVSGVAIYREAFRIRPFGKSDYDWLTLDKKRVQDPSRHIGHNQLSGVVSIEDKRASHLIEQSSREGLRENGAYVRLRRLITELLEREVEPRRLVFRQKAGLERRKDLTFDRVYKAVRLGWARMLVSKVPEADREEIESLIETESNRLEGYVKLLQERQARLEARVTLGLLLGEVMHEANSPLLFLEEEVPRLQAWWPDLFGSAEPAPSRRTEVPAILRGMERSLARLRRLLRILKPLSGRKRGPPTVFDVRRCAEDARDLYKGKIGRLKVAVQIHALPTSNGSMKASGWVDDLITALSNLFDNSLYWFAHHGVPEPRIDIAIENTGERIEARFKDNGPGIPEEFLGRVFDVGFSLKPDGTGLGLNIASEALARSRGTLELSATDDGTAFLISLSKPDEVLA